MYKRQTGNYPGRAKTPEQLRADMKFALSFIPGRKKVNIHASYNECDHFVDRDALEPEHFAAWADWAVENGYGCLLYTSQQALDVFA